MTQVNGRLKTQRIQKMQNRPEEILKDCISAAYEAGEAILKIYNEGFHVQEKADHTPVTEADIKANQIILERLMEKYPEAAFLAEESADDISRREKEWCFIIDPLDGTKEFIKRSNEFTVNIALVRNQRPVLGVVYIPALNDVYYAVKGEGAFKMSKDQRPERIWVSDRTEDIRAAVSRSNSPSNIKEILEGYGIKNIIFAGSALKGCLIASGKAEIYYRGGLTSEWDTAAMQCVIEEAGGILRQLDDSEMLYNREDTLNRKGFYILNREENKIKLKEGTDI